MPDRTVLPTNPITKDHHKLGFTEVGVTQLFKPSKFSINEENLRKMPKNIMNVGPNAIPKANIK